MDVLGAAVALLLEVEQLPLGDAERLVDRLVQVGPLILPHEVVGLVADHDVVAAGDAELDMDHRRDGAGVVVGPLVDADAARGQAVINPLQIRDPRANFAFRPIRAVRCCGRPRSRGTCIAFPPGISDFRRISPLYANARQSRIRCSVPGTERRAEP